MQHISVAQLKKKLDDGEDIQLVDVREPWEHELFNIGGLLIPVGSIMAYMEQIRSKKTVLFFCP